MTLHHSIKLHHGLPIQLTAHRKQTMVLGLIMLLGAIMRFGGIAWGDGLFFHPDENNMAVAITQLKPDDLFKPHFFAYGQFPLYLAYGSFQIVNNVHLFIKSGSIGDTFFKPIPLADAIYYLRFFSALASVTTLLVIYKISKLFFSSIPTRIVVVLFVAVMPGLIQSAHFGTTESILTLLFMLILYRSLQTTATWTNTLMLGFLVGFAAGIKLTGLYCAVPAVLNLLYVWKKRPRMLIANGLFFTLVLAYSYIAASPYNLIAYPEFLGSMRYETTVATGASQVFYTRQFTNTIPYLFPLTNVLPYTVTIPVLIAGMIGCIYGIIKLFRTKSISIIILLVSLMSFFLGNGGLFVKWSRFLTPIFPLVGVCAGFAIERAFNLKRYIYARNSMIGLFAVWSLVSGLIFFSIYIREDTRIQVSTWIFSNIPDKSYILSETANVVDIPVSSSKQKQMNIPNYTVISFNFYYLDEQPELVDSLVDHLEKADYIFVPSRRLFANHLRFPDQYPLLNSYYQALFDGRLGFELVVICSPSMREDKIFTASGCVTSSKFGMNEEFMSKKISASEYSGPPLVGDEAAEETFTVFDHPVIRIYKKIQPHDITYYQQLFQTNK